MEFISRMILPAAFNGLLLWRWSHTGEVAILLVLIGLNFAMYATADFFYLLMRGLVRGEIDAAKEFLNRHKRGDHA